MTTKERVPHADRPTAREFCTCIWVHSPNPDDPKGPALARRHIRIPTCPLHGDHVERSPF